MQPDAKPAAPSSGSAAPFETAARRLLERRRELAARRHGCRSSTTRGAPGQQPAPRPVRAAWRPFGTAARMAARRLSERRREWQRGALVAAPTRPGALHDSGHRRARLGQRGALSERRRNWQRGALSERRRELAARRHGCHSGPAPGHSRAEAIAAPSPGSVAPFRNGGGIGSAAPFRAAGGTAARRHRLPLQFGPGHSGAEAIAAPTSGSVAPSRNGGGIGSAAPFRTAARMAARRHGWRLGPARWRSRAAAIAAPSSGPRRPRRTAPARPGGARVDSSCSAPWCARGQLPLVTVAPA